MTLSSLLVSKSAAAAISWKGAVSVGPLRLFGALARAAPVRTAGVVPAVAGQNPVVAGTPFFFTSGAPSLKSQKPTAKPRAAKPSPKPNKSKPGPKPKKKKKPALAKARVGAKKAKVQLKKAKARRVALAKKAKARRVALAKKAKSAKARAIAKSKARAIAKSKARAVAKAKAKMESRRAEARAMLELRRSLPKRVSSPWLLYCLDNRTKDHPFFADTFKVLMNSWKSSPGSTKQAYKEKAFANSENFRPAMERWIANLTAEQKVLARSMKFLKTLPTYKARAIRRITRKASGKMHGGFTYGFFVKAMYPDVRDALARDRPNLNGRELQNAILTVIAGKWRALSAEQKKAYTPA